MRLTPLDIKKQDFKRIMRGADPEEVQAFLNMVADQWQEMSEEQSRLEHKITELETKLQHYKQVEEALQEAVKTARESSRQTLEAAKQKAQTIVDAAAETAERIHNRAHEDQYALRRDLHTLRSQRTEMIARLKSLLNAELDILDDFNRQFPIPVEAEAEVDVAEPSVDVTEEPAAVAQVDFTEEQQAIEDMAELDATSDPAVEPEQVSADEDDAFDELDGDDYEENTLVFTQDQDAYDEGDGRPAEEVTASQSVHQQGSEPESQRSENHRDSTEMDKIRKILDDLA